MSSTRFHQYLHDKKILIEQALDQILPRAEDEPRLIHEAMRYSVFAGGKRLRPILAVTAYELAGGTGQEIYPLSCGLELLHTYSLIHDDLPCMDDDDLRRGVPTNHKVYGEAMAVLAGDALLPLAFECFLGRGNSRGGNLQSYVRISQEVAAASGSLGLVGGQVMDILKASKDGSLSTLETTCLMKTGRLIQVSLGCGAILAGAGEAMVNSLQEYGRGLGLAFQITDDILNVTGDARKLGKSTKTDAVHDKVTFPVLLGLEESRARAQIWAERARQAIAPFGETAWFLDELASYVVERDS